MYQMTCIESDWWCHMINTKMYHMTCIEIVTDDVTWLTPRCRCIEKVTGDVTWLYIVESKL